MFQDRTHQHNKPAGSTAGLLCLTKATSSHPAFSFRCRVPSISSQIIHFELDILRMVSEFLAE